MAIAAASTIPFYGLGLRLFPQADQRTDRFQLRVGNVGAFKALSRLPALFRGTFDDPGVHDFFCSAVSIEVVKPSPLQIGGDEVGVRERAEIGMTNVRGVHGRNAALASRQAAAADSGAPAAGSGE